MDEARTEPGAVNIRAIIQEAISEFIRSEQARTEPAYKAELVEERRRREALEQRLNELEDENRRNRQLAEEADRNSQIRSELQRLGVQKIDLAFKAVRDEIIRTDDGRLMARAGKDELALPDFLHQFVNENPELLPARIAGGSGTQGNSRSTTAPATVDLDKIRPGMSAEEMDRVRQEIARVASQALRAS
ncbi:MAG: hypothetical protein IT160_20805 [Bryobacterales bacterium]|nr:hypothetical protein [Bryobacterales bacterium]